MFLCYICTVQHTAPPDSQPLFTQDQQEDNSGRSVGEILFPTDTVEVEVGTTVPGDDPVTVPGTFENENDDDDGQGETDPEVRMSNAQATSVCNKIMQIIQHQLEQNIAGTETQCEEQCEIDTKAKDDVNEGECDDAEVNDENVVDATIDELESVAESVERAVSPIIPRTTRSGRVVKKPRMSID